MAKKPTTRSTKGAANERNTAQYADQSVTTGAGESSPTHSPVSRHGTAPNSITNAVAARPVPPVPASTHRNRRHPGR